MALLAAEEARADWVLAGAYTLPLQLNVSEFCGILWLPVVDTWVITRQKLDKKRLTDQNSLNRAERWTSVSPWVLALMLPKMVIAELKSGSRHCGRGLHSSTIRLNVSAFCGTGGAFRGCLGGIYEVLGDMQGCLGCLGCSLCQKRLTLS